MKITSANLCKPSHGIMNHSTFILNLESVERKAKNDKNYLETEKSFRDEIKNIFCSF